jgi:hypothetical protein
MHVVTVVGVEYSQPSRRKAAIYVKVSFTLIWLHGFCASSFASSSAAAPSDLVIYTNSFGSVILFAFYYRSCLPADVMV